MLYFRVKFEANNEPMYLGTRRGIEMWSAYAGGELFTETEVKNNSLNYDSDSGQCQSAQDPYDGPVPCADRRCKYHSLGLHCRPPL